MTSSPTEAEVEAWASRVAERHAAVEAQMVEACGRAGRARDEVTLVAVSKTHPDAAVAALARLGVRVFGENKVQAFVARRLAFPELELHLIGPLQTNKAKDVVKAPPALLHTVDRAAVVDALAARMTASGAGASLQPLRCLVQVDVDGEATKSGVAPDELDALVDKVVSQPGLCFRGLMCIPRPSEDVGEVATRAAFARLRALLEAVADRVQGGRAGELSMGMSDDFAWAIEEGATLVRVGTALFGERVYAPPTG